LVLQSFAVKTTLQDGRVRVLDGKAQPRRQTIAKYYDAKPVLVRRRRLGPGRRPRGGRDTGGWIPTATLVDLAWATRTDNDGDAGDDGKTRREPNAGTCTDLHHL
jgi:hypothetical protein